jgi:intein/homing endonuclease
MKIESIKKREVPGLPIYDIKFDNGKIYSYTSNHKLKTENGWKKIEKLKENEIILDTL